MPVEMRKLLDKYFLPCFYGLCVLGLVIATIFFLNVKQQQKDALLAYETNLNIKKANETLKLEKSENITSDELIYTSSDESIIKVDENGNLISLGEGTAVLTITTKDSSQSQDIVVNVGPDAINEYLKKHPKDNSKIEETIPFDPSLPEMTEDDVISHRILPTSITVSETDINFNLNSDKKKVELKANVLPLSATDKTVIWSSSNSKVATVSDGTVTAKEPGTTTITATTKDGNLTATSTVTVTKKIVIVIGDSQVTKMSEYKTSYSTESNKYKTKDKSLIYINKSGSGLEYQTTTGIDSAKKIIDTYSTAKNETEFYIYFPLTGNTIKNYSCDEIETSNEQIKNYAVNYNQVITNLKQQGYKVNAYVVSVQPLKVSQSTSDKVVNNENKQACTKEYKSNWKYNQFNKTMKKIIESNYSENLKFESLFVKIMEINDVKKEFNFKSTYNTTDGIHWDKETTKKYVDMMLNYSEAL